MKIPKVMRTLLDAISDDDLDAVANAWREALGAVTRTYDLPKKRWIEQPDHNTRIKAANMIAAYKEGLPVQRQLRLDASVKDLGETLAGTSPAALRMLEVMDSLRSGQSVTSGDEGHDGTGREEKRLPSDEL